MSNGERLKKLLGDQADTRLKRLGYSSRRADDAKRAAWWWLQARGGALKGRRRIFRGWAIYWLNAGAGSAELTPIEVVAAGPCQVTIDVLSSTVSPGTERAQYLRLPNARPQLPYRPGYSVAGVVRAVGAGVDHVAVGDLVAASGVPHASVATVAAGNVYKLPPGLSPEAAATIKLGVISAQGVGHARLEPGEDVAVVGAGLIGLLAARIALADGAGKTTMIARSRSKQAIATADGASAFLIDEEREAIEALAAPVVFDVTGSPAGFPLAIDAAGPGARLILLGSPRGATLDVPVDRIRAKGISVIGAHVETLTYASKNTGTDLQREAGERYLRLLASGAVRVDDLVERAVDPREAGAFYRELATSSDIVGARFDWTRMPQDERVGSARALRVPDLLARGSDAGTVPLPAPTTTPAAAWRPDVDPFAGAAGMLRIGMIGCGDIAVHNASAIAKAPNAKLIACFDVNPELSESLAAMHDAAVANSTDELLARDDVDAVFICVPHHLHAPIAVEVAQAGKHVIVEKPPANELAGAVEMTQAASRAGVELSVCFPQRYQPNVVSARRLVESGAIGELSGAFAQLLMDRSPAYWVGGFSGRSVSSWRESRAKAGGGVLIMNLSHYLDLVRHIGGVEIVSIGAVAAAADRPAEVEDTISASMRFSNGAVGSLLGSTAVRGALAMDLRLWGTDGHVAVEGKPEIYTLRSIDGVRTTRWQSFGPLPNVDIRAIYVSRLATAIAEGRRPEIGARDALAVQAIMEAAYRSTETGEAVDPAALLEGAPA